LPPFLFRLDDMALYPHRQKDKKSLEKKPKRCEIILYGKGDLYRLFFSGERDAGGTG
jgi:hypothetical protein